MHVLKIVMKREMNWGIVGVLKTVIQSLLKSEVNNMEQKHNGIIFTAIPDKSNEYYRPFYEDLIYFNEYLNEKQYIYRSTYIFIY